MEPTIGIVASGILLETTASVSNMPEPTQPEVVEPENPDRAIILDSLNPRDDVDANSKAWFTVSQLGGVVTETLGRDAGFDRHFLGRFANSFYDLWWNWSTQYVSHEMAHDYLLRKKGLSASFEVDFLDWAPYFFPEYRQMDKKTEAYDPDVLKGEDLEQFLAWAKESQNTPITFDERCYDYCAGLYQSEFDASLALRLRLSRNRFLSDEALTHLVPKIADSVYSIADIDDGDPINYINRVGIRVDPNLETADGTYQEIHYTMADFQKYALLADILSFSNWESLYCAFDYLISGTLAHKPSILNLGDWGIYPPDFRMFASTDGFYLDAEIPLRFSDNRFLFINVGSTVDNFGDEGRGNRIRFGAQYNSGSIDAGDGFWAEFNPFIYLNTNSSGEYIGHDIGIEGVIRYNRFGISARVRHSEDDMIETTIKANEDGWRFRLGISLKY